MHLPLDILLSIHKIVETMFGATYICRLAYHDEKLNVAQHMLISEIKISLE